MSGFRVSVVAVQTPWPSFCMAMRWPMPVTKTSLALGARRRKVTLPSAETSGDFTGGAPRPGPGAVGAGAGAAGACAAAVQAALRSRITVVNFMRCSKMIMRVAGLKDKEECPHEWGAWQPKKATLQRLFDGGQEIGFRGEAFEALDLLAAAVEDQRDRQLIEVVLLVERLAAQAHGVIHRVLFEEGLDACGALVVHRDAQHGDALPGEVLVQFVETGDLLNTGHAPRRPEVHHHDLAG